MPRVFAIAIAPWLLFIYPAIVHISLSLLCGILEPGKCLRKVCQKPDGKM